MMGSIQNWTDHGSVRLNGSSLDTPYAQIVIGGVSKATYPATTVDTSEGSLPKCRYLFVAKQQKLQIRIQLAWTAGGKMSTSIFGEANSHPRTEPHPVSNGPSLLMFPSSLGSLPANTATFLPKQTF